MPVPTTLVTMSLKRPESHFALDLQGFLRGQFCLHRVLPQTPSRPFMIIRDHVEFVFVAFSKPPWLR